MGLFSFLKGLKNNEEESSVNQSENTVEETISLEIDEEEKVVVALAASIMAAEDKPDSRFHISSIRRIK